MSNAKFMDAPLSGSDSDKSKISEPATPAKNAPKAAPTVKQDPDKRTYFMLYDGSYESAFLAVKLARDTKNAKATETPDDDYNLVIFEPKLSDGDGKTFAKVKELIDKENGAVEIRPLSVDLGDLSNPDGDKLLACLETALSEALKAGLKATVLKVTWTTDRINSNKDVYQNIMTLKAPVLINKLEKSIPENQGALKDNKPLVRSVGIDWANFGKLDVDIDKQKTNLGLHEIFKDAVVNG